MKEPKKSIGTMDVVLIVLAVFLLIFIIAMTWIFCVTGSIPDTLVTCVFGICAGECSIMGWIKTTKDRHRNRAYGLEEDV